MQAMIDELAKQAAESLGQVSSKETLASFWQEYLSKNGKIPALMKNLRTVAPEERPAMPSSFASAISFAAAIPLSQVTITSTCCPLHSRLISSISPYPSLIRCGIR